MPSPVELVIEPRPRDLGGFEVRRVQPFVKRRMVGPFVFLDHIGPAVFAPGTGIDVRPHPHIGLATVTYLFEGEMMHRDSVGAVQNIMPGDVNWMTAGRGRDDPRAGGLAADAAGRRQYRAAPHLVEPGVEPARADRAGEGRLEGAPVPEGAGRNRIHAPS